MRSGSEHRRQVKSGSMEQASSRGHETSPQNGLGVGCRRCPSTKKKLRGLGLRAPQARCVCMPPSFPVAGASSLLSPTRSATSRRARRICMPLSFSAAGFPSFLSPCAARQGIPGVILGCRNAPNPLRPSSASTSPSANPTTPHPGYSDPREIPYRKYEPARFLSQLFGPWWHLLTKHRAQLHCPVRAQPPQAFRVSARLSQGGALGEGL